MARVQNTLIGRASGSVGEVVFLTWRLINVTRSKPVSVSNPNTILQQQQRNRFGATVELYRILKEVLAVGLKNRNRKMTLFNFFQYLNQQNCFDNVGDGTVAFLPEHLIISYGLAQKLKQGGIQTLEVEGIVRVLFAGGNPPVENDNDLFFGVAFNEDTGQWGLSAPNTLWVGSQKNIYMPSSYNINQRLHIWWFFTNNSMTKIGQTSYVTTLSA